jgi:hypothetical protein
MSGKTTSSSICQITQMEFICWNLNTGKDRIDQVKKGREAIK